jgi:nucleotide-binding universal stress UspA family protein
MELLRILAPLVGAEAERGSLELAADIASRTNAQVLALHPEIDPLTSLAWLSGPGVTWTAELVQMLEESSQKRADQAKALVTEVRKVRALDEKSDALVFMRRRGLSIADIVSAQSASSDLAVFPDTGSAPDSQQAFQGALIAGQAPCLLVRNPHVFAGPIAIGWDGGVRAGRALRAAMPFARIAKKVLILHAPEGLSPRRQTDAAPAELCALLARQGLEAKVKIVHDQARDGVELLRAAADASLLACGAYGHSRAQEFFFGGATRSFLEAKGGPSLLLTH